MRSVTIRPDLSLVLDGLGSDKSRAVYRTALLRFHSWWVMVGKPPLTKALVQRYKVVLCESGLAPSSVNVHLSAVRKLALEAADAGAFDQFQAAAIGRVPGVRHNGRKCGQWLTKDQARHLLNVPQSGIIGIRDRAILSVMIGAGLRRSEVVSLKLYHFQRRDNRHVIIDLIGKGNRVRSIPIADWVYERVRDWLDIASITTGYIFRRVRRGGCVMETVLTDRAIYDIIKKYTDVAPHDLRRSYCHFCYDSGADLLQLSYMMGHASMKTTQRYLNAEVDFKNAPCDGWDLTGGN